MPPSARTKDTADRETLERELALKEGEILRLRAELAEVRASTAQLIAQAEDRLHYMDEYYLGPDTFEKRRYVRLLVRTLKAMRDGRKKIEKLRTR